MFGLGSAARAIARVHGFDILRPISAVALLAGASVVQLFPRLPSRSFDALIFIAGIFLAASRRKFLPLGLFLIGIAWTAWRADVALSHRLPHELENADLQVVGSIHDLPRVLDRETHFEFDIDQAEKDGEKIPFHGRVRIGWYENAPEIQACQRWRLVVRLKRPRGTINPGGFDFERFALERDIVATGSVRASADDGLIDTPWCLDDWREHIGATISAALDDKPSAGLLRALAFGDEHAMDDTQWSVVRATGIPHLIAISGLHIALFAGFGVALVRLLWRFAPRILLRASAPMVESVVSLIFACAYAAIAGFGLPTRRALVMIAAMLIANLARRARAPLHGLSLALVVLLIVDPLCVLSAGFWLSFVGVAWLMWCIDGTPRLRHSWKQLVRSQGVATLGLLPLGIAFFGQSSLIAPIANFVAVPVICFFVLPLGVFSALLTLAFPTFGTPLLNVVGYALDALWWLLEHLAALPGALWFFPEPSLISFALAMIGAFWLLMPRGVPLRACGALMLLPLLWPQREMIEQGRFDAFALDVGQGLSFVVRTRDHTLLYDAGPRFPSGFDVGESTVAPALHALGIERLDRMMISHRDSDHAGGASAVAENFRDVDVRSGEPERLKIFSVQCRAGDAWTWDGVVFRVLSPASLEGRGNERCCVLDIRAGESELLLPGDIPASIESAISSDIVPAPAHSVLQSPHHGSKTSSSAEFLDALQPELAIVSSGYLNRFHHPSSEIVERYAERGIPMLNTAETGFVHLKFDGTHAAKVVERGRVDRHPYWRE